MWCVQYKCIQNMSGLSCSCVISSIDISSLVCEYNVIKIQQHEDRIPFTLCSTAVYVGGRTVDPRGREIILSDPTKESIDGTRNSIYLGAFFSMRT